jgi:hypothetical protein
MIAVLLWLRIDASRPVAGQGHMGLGVDATAIECRMEEFMVGYGS